MLVPGKHNPYWGVTPTPFEFTYSPNYPLIFFSLHHVKRHRHVLLIHNIKAIIKEFICMREKNTVYLSG
jgi:hypothetical protein